MGTHCAMVVRDQNEIVVRYERTMDGDQLPKEFREWCHNLYVESKHKEFPDPERIGSNCLEIGNEGESDQEYWLILDIPKKQFLFGGWTLTTITWEATSALIQKGWTFINDNDHNLIRVLWDPSLCPTGSTTYPVGSP